MVVGPAGSLRAAPLAYAADLPAARPGPSAMQHPPPGRHRTVEAFRAHWREVAPELDCDLALEGPRGPLGAPLTVFGRRVANRFAIHPMEGWDGTPEGGPTERTLRRWRASAQRRAADLGRRGLRGRARRVAPTPTSSPWRRAPDTPASPGGPARGPARGHRGPDDDPDALVVGLQLTHSGRFAPRGRRQPAPRIAFRHPVLDARVGDRGRAPVSQRRRARGDRRALRRARAARQRGRLRLRRRQVLPRLPAARAARRAHAPPGPTAATFENRTRFLLDDRRRDPRGLPRASAIGVRVSIGDVIPFARPGSERVGAPPTGPGAEPYRVRLRRRPARPDRASTSASRCELLRLLGAARRPRWSTSRSARPTPARTCSARGLPAERRLPAAGGSARGRRRAPARSCARASARTRTWCSSARATPTCRSGCRTSRSTRSRHGHVDLVGIGRMVLVLPRAAARRAGRQRRSTGASGSAAPSATARRRRATAWSAAAIHSTTSTATGPRARAWPRSSGACVSAEQDPLAADTATGDGACA